MSNFLSKIKNSAFLSVVKKILSNKYFPFITSAVLLACYYLGWDIVAIYYIGIVGLLILLLLDDISPVINLFLFLGVIVSLKNSPSSAMGGSDYYSRTANLVQIIIIISLLILALVYRAGKTVYKKQFKPTPVLWGLCALASAMLINGVFSTEYSPRNLIFGSIMAVCFLGVFVAVKDNLKTDGDCFERIAYGFIALSVLLIIELIVAYATTEDLFIDGTINRGALVFGWGVYTMYGAMIVMCIPACLYLAGRHKLGYLFTVYSLFILVATFLSCCRQAMVGAVIIYPTCLIILLVKGKNRIPNLCIAGVALLVGIILACVFRHYLIDFIKTIFQNAFEDGKPNGSGRWRLWTEAWNYFKSAPAFGVGFYVNFSYANISGLSFFPLMCHNTILQLLSACGIFGLATYLVHRVQTVISYFKYITVERTFIALTVAVLLIICLLDNHIFNIYPTIIYSGLIAVLVKSEKKKEKIN